MEYLLIILAAALLGWLAYCKHRELRRLRRDHERQEQNPETVTPQQVAAARRLMLEAYERAQDAPAAAPPSPSERGAGGEAVTLHCYLVRQPGGSLFLARTLGTAYQHRGFYIDRRLFPEVTADSSPRRAFLQIRISPQP